MNKVSWAHVALLGANLIYGINYSVAKIALNGPIQPFGFVFIRVIVAMIIFWLIHFFFIKEKIVFNDVPRLFLCGIFGIALNQLFFFQGLSLTTEINASLIMITTPVLVLVMSNFLLHEKITRLKFTGIILGASGAFLLIGYGNTIESMASLGDLFIFLNAAFYSLYLVLVKPLMKKYHPLTVIKWVFLFGFSVVLVAGYRQFAEIEWNVLDWTIWASIIYVVIFTTFFAYLLNIFALHNVNPSIVGVYIYLQPLIATLIAISFGTDYLSIPKVIAAVLIFTGVYLTSNMPFWHKIRPV